MTTTALALAERPQTALIRPVVAPAEVMAIHKQISEMVQKTLIESKDFGTIPGTGKPSLYKAGAERLCVGFGLVDRYEIVEKEVDHNFRNEWVKRRKEWSGPRGQRTSKTVEETGIAYGLYRYTVKCLLYRREDDVLVAEGVGACSTLEAKYCDRPRDMENTILKMAKKRAKVDAVLTGLGLSDRFTQDVEDTGVGAGEVEDEHGQPTQRPAGDEVARTDHGRPSAAQRGPDTRTEVTNLARAIEYPLPWKKHPKYGTPIVQLSNKHLERALEWCVQARKEAAAENRQPGYVVTNLEQAISLILAARETGELETPPDEVEDPSQTKMFEGDPESGMPKLAIPGDQPDPTKTPGGSSAAGAPANGSSKPSNGSESASPTSTSGTLLTSPRGSSPTLRPAANSGASETAAPDPANDTKHPYRANTHPDGRLALDALENTDPDEASAYDMGRVIRDAIEKGPFTGDERKTLKKLFTDAGTSTKKLAMVRSAVLNHSRELPF